MTVYEKQRMKTIEENKTKMKAAGLDEKVYPFKGTIPMLQNEKSKGKKRGGGGWKPLRSLCHFPTMRNQVIQADQINEMKYMHLKRRYLLTILAFYLSRYGSSIRAKWESGYNQVYEQGKRILKCCLNNFELQRVYIMS
ncbi:hypothetical protein Hanom_Chr07g00640861 [Helianthus anomalus]